MIAYYFRVINDGKPNGYVGLAVAHDKKDLYWKIDEWCDPDCVQIKVAKRGGYCLKQTTHLNYKEIEISEWSPLFNDKGWKTPIWPDK